MKIELNGKTYTSNKVKTRVFRRALEISESVNFNNLKVSDLDKLIGFVCELYGNQFSIDELYDGLEADKLISTFSESMNGIIGGVADKLESFPE